MDMPQPPGRPVPSTLTLDPSAAELRLMPLPGLVVDDAGVLLAVNDPLLDLLELGPEVVGSSLASVGLRLDVSPVDDAGAGAVATSVDLVREPGAGTPVRMGGLSWQVRPDGDSGPAVRYTVLGGGTLVLGDGAGGRSAEGDLLHLLVDNAVDYAIFTLTPSGHVSSWTLGAERIKGYRSTEIIGRHFSVFYSPEDVQRRHPEHELELAARDGRYTEEGWRVRKDGSRLWASITLIALRGPDGQLRGFGKVTKDLTAERAAQEALRVSEERFRELAESMTDAYVLADWPADADDASRPARDGVPWKVRYAGGAFTEIFGLDRADVVAARARIENVVHPDDVHRVHEEWAKPDLGGARELQFRVINAGRPVWVRARYRWLPSTSSARLASIFEDITQQKADEAELQRVRKEATEANLAKSEFLSRMSHELRTPLNAILGFTQLLELQDPSLDAVEAVQYIRRAGEHLLTLINEVLDIARIESGQMTISAEPLQLRELGQEVIDLMGPLAAAADVGLGITGADHVWALGDRQRTRQVLLNLLSNAVKYNRPGGRVTVTLTADDATVRVRVDDTGIGIAADLMPRLFQAFDRLGAESSQIEGVGVGLALSQRLADAMGGSLTATSQQGIGSSFTLELPAAAQAVPEAPSADAPVPHTERDTGRTLRVVYVEDNTPNVRLLQAVLRLRPRWSLVHAGTGALAVQLISADPPDLVLLDLHLPDISGEVVLARLRGDTSTASIPVIVVSADATPGRIMRLLDAGARSYVTKPLQMTEVLAALDTRREEVDRKAGGHSSGG